MSFDENNIIFKQYSIPDKYDKSLIFSKTLQDYIAVPKELKGQSSGKKVAIFVDIRKVHEKWSIFCFYGMF